VLELDPNNTTALASLTSLSYNQARIAPFAETLDKLEHAREWNGRLLAIAPQDKEAHYWAGVIVWSEFYPALMAARVSANMRPEDPGPLPPAAARLELLSKYGQMVDDGMKHLRQAIEVDSQYDDAMAYLNLLIRERADLRDTAEEYKQDIQEADNWVWHALASKKLKAQSARNAPPPPAPPPPPPQPSDARSFAAPPVGLDPANATNSQRSGVIGDFNPLTPPTPQRIKISGNVVGANLIRKVDPVCPQPASAGANTGSPKIHRCYLERWNASKHSSGSWSPPRLRP
jgi:hypothetical protein